MSESSPEFRPHEPPPIPAPAGVGSPGRHVLIGLLIGGALSLVTWPIVFVSDNGNAILIALGVLVGLKLIVGIALIARGPWTRFYGIGLLISIALGGLIFFGTCGIAILTTMQHGH